MPIQQDIRRLDRQGVSRTRIAKRLGVDRATVAKYADMEDLSPAAPKDRRRGTKMDRFAAIVDAWLEADLRMPAKQRHTARRVFDRLVDEHGFDGSYSGVQRYVKRWREEHRADSEGFLDLAWHAGEMQVDFGQALVMLAGRETLAHVLVVSLPFSNMRLCVPMPAENAECLCAGLLAVFGRIGGVPPVLVMDNATGAGHRRSDGSVTLTDVFASFIAHHRIEVRFCNPYSGHEKGSVENAVGFLRRNLLVPIQSGESWEQLGRVMLDRCERVAAEAACPNRPGSSVADVFAEERGELLALPSVRFDAVRWENRRTDKYGRAELDGHRYLAGGGWCRRTVTMAVRWNMVTLMDPATGRIAAEYPRAYGDGGSVMADPALVMPMLTKKPRAWRNSPVRGQMPADVIEWLDAMDETDLKTSLGAIAESCRTAGFAPAMDACRRLRQTAGTRPPRADELTPVAMRIRDGEAAPSGPDLSAYDLFLGKEA